MSLQIISELGISEFDITAARNTILNPDMDTETGQIKYANAIDFLGRNPSMWFDRELRSALYTMRKLLVEDDTSIGRSSVSEIRDVIFGEISFMIIVFDGLDATQGKSWTDVESEIARCQQIIDTKLEEDKKLGIQFPAHSQIVEGFMKLLYRGPEK